MSILCRPPDAGRVEIAAEAFVLPYVVAPGDVNFIRSDEHTNIQDGAIIHVNSESPTHPKGLPMLIGAHVAIGNHCLVGMSSTIME